jgi:hypothetical protein
MSRVRVFLDESDMFAYHANGPRRIGTIGWDSRNGRLWGTLSERIRAACQEAALRGFVEIAGPVPSSIEIRIRDPFHSAKELAAIMVSLGFDPPIELARYYRPKFRDDFKKSDHKRVHGRATQIFY